MNASEGSRPDIRGNRLRLGLTMKHLAKKCQEDVGVPVSASEISRIERHIHAPRPALRKALAGLLGMSTSDFPITGDRKTKKPAAKKPERKPGPGKRVSGVWESGMRVSAEDHVGRLGLDPGTEKALTSAGAATVADVARLVEHGDLIEIPDIETFQRAVIERVLCETGLYPTKPCLTGERHPVTETCLVGCLGVSTRTSGTLTRADAGTVAEAVQLIKTGEIRSVRGLGSKGRDELQIALIKADLQWY